MLDMHRRTGRTQRQIDAAVRLANTGADVVYLCRDDRHATEVFRRIPRLDDGAGSVMVAPLASFRWHGMTSAIFQDHAIDVARVINLPYYLRPLFHWQRWVERRFDAWMDRVEGRA
jgi:hypothetical protein